MSENDLADAATALDRALDAKPHLDGAALTEAIQALCRHRDGLRRVLPPHAAPSPGLKAVNGLISLVHAVHFPLGGVPWPLLADARKGIDELTGNLAADVL